MQNINSLLINSNLALHFVLGTYHILLRNMTLQKQWVSWPFLHIKHSFSCRFLHNSHSKRWPGISSLPFLGSSSKFSWRRSNPQRIIVHISVLSSRPCWEEVATSLKRDYQSLFSSALQRRHLRRQREICAWAIFHTRHSHVFCSKHVQNSNE